MGSLKQKQLEKLQERMTSLQKQADIIQENLANELKEQRKKAHPLIGEAFAKCMERGEELHFVSESDYLSFLDKFLKTKKDREAFGLKPRPRKSKKIAPKNIADSAASVGRTEAKKESHKPQNQQNLTPFPVASKPAVKAEHETEKQPKRAARKLPVSNTQDLESQFNL